MCEEDKKDQYNKKDSSQVLSQETFHTCIDSDNTSQNWLNYAILVKQKNS